MLLRVSCIVSKGMVEERGVPGGGRRLTVEAAEPQLWGHVTRLAPLGGRVLISLVQSVDVGVFARPRGGLYARLRLI